MSDLLKDYFPPHGPEASGEFGGPWAKEPADCCPFCNAGLSPVNGLYECGTLPGSDSQSVHCSTFGTAGTSRAGEVLAANLRALKLSYQRGTASAADVGRKTLRALERYEAASGPSKQELRSSLAEALRGHPEAPVTQRQPDPETDVVAEARRREAFYRGERERYVQFGAAYTPTTRLVPAGINRQMADRLRAGAGNPAWFYSVAPILTPQ